MVSVARKAHLKRLAEDRHLKKFIQRRREETATASQEMPDRNEEGDTDSEEDFEINTAWGVEDFGLSLGESAIQMDDDGDDSDDQFSDNDASSGVIAWTDQADQALRGAWGAGSASTDKRQRRRQRELAEAATNCRTLKSFWTKQASSSVSHESAPDVASNEGEDSSKAAKRALEELTEFLSSKKTPIEKMKAPLAAQCELRRRCEMLKSFLWRMQQPAAKGKYRRDIAIEIARSNQRGDYTGRLLVQWEKSWIATRMLPATQAGGNRKFLWWTSDEGITQQVRDWAREEGDKVTSYRLASFVGECLEKLKPAGAQQNPAEVMETIEAAINAEETGASIEGPTIQTRTIRRWLHRLGFDWREVKKGVFVDGHERPDVIQYRQEFVSTIRQLLPYFVEFNADGTMKEKSYPPDCSVGGQGQKPIIAITHDESVFSANDGRRYAWNETGKSFLRPKGKGKGIMVSDFLLPWGRLGFKHLPQAEKDRVIESGLAPEAAVYFEFGQHDGYWDGKCLLEQLKEKALPVAEQLYPGYQLLFLFDNATSHAVYEDNALRVGSMSKNEGGSQPLLRDGWYERDGHRVDQPMSFAPNTEDAAHRVPKGIQRVLKERGLWPAEGLLLECPRPKCDACLTRAKCQTCVKGKRCSSCLEGRKHSSSCSVRRQCDACVGRKERCTCVPKSVCSSCAEAKGRKCTACESMPSRCASDSKLVNKSSS